VVVLEEERILAKPKHPNARLDAHCWKWAQYRYSCDYSDNFRFRKIIREIKGLEPLVQGEKLICVKNRNA